MHALPEFLQGTTPAEAVGYVLPLLNGLAMDLGTPPARPIHPAHTHHSHRADEQVKEALAAELIPIIWWFFTVGSISLISRRYT